MSQRGIRSPMYNPQKLKRGSVLIRFTLDHPERQAHVTRKSVENIGEKKSEGSVSYQNRRQSSLTRPGACTSPSITMVTSSSPHLDYSSPSISVATSSGFKTKPKPEEHWKDQDLTSGGCDVTDENDGCLVSCFPNCQKPTYRAGQVITGTVLVKPVFRLTISGVFVKMWGIESTKWRSRERMYSGERIFFKQMVVIVKNRLTILDTKWYKYDFEYQLLADLPPSFKMEDGSRKYRACAVISQPYGPDLEGHQVGFLLAGNSMIDFSPCHLRDEYEIRFSTNQPLTHVKCSCHNKPKTPPSKTSSSPPTTSTPLMTSSSRSVLHQRSLPKPSSSSSSSSRWSSISSIKSTWMNFIRRCCCCECQRTVKNRTDQNSQSRDSKDDLARDPCDHLDLLLRFNSDINYDNEVFPLEMETKTRDGGDEREQISGSLRINGRVFAPMDQIQVQCRINNHHSLLNLSCRLKLIRVTRFTMNEATVLNDRKPKTHPRRFKIKPMTKTTENNLLTTDQISISPKENKYFGFRFGVPYKIISNTPTLHSDRHGNSEGSFSSISSQDVTDEEIITISYFCLVEIWKENPNDQAAETIVIPIEIIFADGHQKA